MEYKYLTKDGDYLVFARKIFSKYFPFDNKSNSYNNLDGLYSKLGDVDKDKLLKISFFYYFRGWNLMQKENWYEEVSEDFIFIILISITECLMSEYEYIGFIDWIVKNHRPCGDINQEKEEYLKQYGIKTKFVNFFERYLLTEDSDDFIDKIKQYCEIDNRFNNFSSIDDIADLFYSLRCDFVHNAQYVPISAAADTSGFSVKNKHYSVGKKFSDIVKSFERGYLNYFASKIK